MRTLKHEQKYTKWLHKGSSWRRCEQNSTSGQAGTERSICDGDHSWTNTRELTRSWSHNQMEDLQTFQTYAGPRLKDNALFAFDARGRNAVLSNVRSGGTAEHRRDGLIP